MIFRFPITSEQLTLLHHLENASNLDQLSQMLNKEKSVVSKNLKGLHLEFPTFLRKNERRWEITDQGKRLNKISNEFVEKLTSIIPNQQKEHLAPVYNSDKSVLMIMNPQKAFEESHFGPSSNPDAISQIKLILALWRQLERKVVFVKHLSNNKDSPLSADSPLSEFIDSIGPKKGEKVIVKTVATAFEDIELDDQVEIDKWDNLILVGFTAAECIDATAKDANRLGISPFIIADAVSTSNLVGPNGEIFHSKLVLGVTLASLHKNVATILDSKTFIEEIQ